ncbi:MAG: hypothetical protein AAFQ07_14980, partial [Chloroflexota bacterium]
MRIRTLILTLMISLLLVPFVVAQEDTAYELPALQAGDSVDASFQDNITTHLYAFHGSAGDSVSITMTQDDPALDPFLILLDAEGAVIAYDDDSGSEVFSAALTADLDTDGAYFVLATSFNFVDGAEVETDDELIYTLTIDGMTTPADVDDADSVTAEFATLALGEATEGESTDDTPAAFFTFEGAEGDSIVISLQDADFFTVLHVFNPDGERIAVDPSLVEIDLEDDGIYLILATAPFFYEAID